MTCLLRYISKVARTTFQLALLVIFFWFFGLPAIEKYQERKVMVVESWRSSWGMQAPVVTIFANNELNGTSLGTYKNGSFEQVCGSLKGNNTIENCIYKNSNKKSDFLVDVLLGYKGQISLMSEQHVKAEFSRPIFGKYYSLNLPLQLRPRDEDQISFLLSHQFTYFFPFAQP